MKFRRRLPPENFLKEPLGLGMEEKHFDVDFVTYTLIVDDIVHPDGSTAMACLGGGGYNNNYFLIFSLFHSMPAFVFFTSPFL